MKSVIFCEGKLLLTENKEFPPADCTLQPVGEIFHLPGHIGYAVSAEESHNFVATDLRESCNFLSESDYAAASKCAELIYWDAGSRYCGKCGAPMVRHTEISKICTACTAEIFPAVSPCIIVLISRGEEALLVRNRNFRRNFFGLVAGFVETGESLEQCVAREVKEETGLEITNLSYFGSQAWPFPAQLMVGFTAEYAGGELKFLDGELSEGGFFSRENPPQIPPPPSIARKMILHWLQDQ